MHGNLSFDPSPWPRLLGLLLLASQASLLAAGGTETQAKHFATPTLVITGELDYRFPYTQSRQYFTALRRQGVPARLVVLPGSGHWPGWTDMVLYYSAPLDWFHRYLGEAPWSLEDLLRNRVFHAQQEQGEGESTEKGDAESSGRPELRPAATARQQCRAV